MDLTFVPDLAIKNGGSKSEIFPQLDDIGRIGTDRRPRFSIDVCWYHERNNPNRYQHFIDVLIDGINSADGSGVWWFITGCVNDDRRFLGQAGGVNSRFYGYYDTNKRQGWLWLGDPSWLKLRPTAF